MSLSGIEILKNGNEYILITNENIDTPYMKKWYSTPCKYFIRNMKKEKYEKYLCANADGIYYLLYEIDLDEDWSVDVIIGDKKYSLIAVSDYKDYRNTKLKYFKLDDYFYGVVSTSTFEIEEIVDEDDDISSKSLFDDAELND